jgi:hypothetical protein
MTPIFRFQMKHLLTSVHHKDQPLNEIADHVLNQNHSVVGSSPRFCKGAVSVNYQSSMESSLRNLWNFLAMIGAYQYMLILLPHPPAQCCSLSTQSLKAYVLHKFNVHYTPLYKSWDLGGEAAEDLYHRPMKCEGTVRNKDGFDTLLAALTHLHDKHAKKYIPPAMFFNAQAALPSSKMGELQSQGLIPVKFMQAGNLSIVAWATPLLQQKQPKTW